MATKAKPIKSDGALPPKPKNARWTDAQWAGIATTGRSVLVSAAAGSGKTAVLSERCAYLVCDAKPPCDVDELLVVTFTEAAAAEMKSRIERALQDRFALGGSDKRLTRQLALIDRAQVSTLHGFCARLIRQHFHLLGLDPAFTVIDGDEAKLMRYDIARRLLAEQYESGDADAFQSFVDAYGDGNDERLVAKIIDAHELLASLVDPEKWLTDARNRITELTEKSFEETTLGQEFLAEVKAKIESLGKACAANLQTVSAMEGFAKYVAALEECRQILRHWYTTLKDAGLDALAEESKIELPRLPSVPSATPNKETAKALVDLIRDQIKAGPIRKMLAFSTAQWTDGMKRVAPHAKIFLDLVESFGSKYAEEKNLLRGVDFSDLERLALRSLRDESGQPSGVAKLLHKQFKHVLVDEYQDINELQDTVLRLVSRECVDPQANLFAVGDVKQSIYGFRLAEPTRFLARESEFRLPDAGGCVIDLQANFRSRAPLLEVLNLVFARLMTKRAADLDYDAKHELKPGIAYPPGDATCFTGSPVELHLLPKEIDPEAAESTTTAQEDIEPDRSAREALLIGQLIQKITGADGSAPRCVMDKGPGGTLAARPIRFGDIVILLRSMRYKGDDYADVLRASGIPVHSETGTGYFDSMEVRDMLALLSVLDNRRQDIPLAALLRSPIANIPHPEDALAQIRLAYDKREVPFHEAVTRFANDDTHDDELAAKLRDLFVRIERWREMAQRRPLAELIWDIYDSTGYLAFCAGLRDGEQRKANLIDLHERARQFGTFQRQGLARFLAFLERLEAESDLGQPPIASAGENVVRIMTVHRSKGLEFPVVILPDLGKAINLRDCAGSILLDRHAHVGMDVVDEAKQVRYPSLASTLVAARLRQQAMAEELRVLYVAMTRAREHLILVGTCKETSAESWAARWGGHVGPIPADEVVGARSMLDWLGPVACALHSPGSTPIRIIQHSSTDVAGWPNPEKLRADEGARIARLAELQPLKPAPAEDAAAKKIIDHLKWQYPFERFANLAATESATGLTKKDAPPSLVAGTQKSKFDEGVRLDMPRAVQTEIKPSAADIGSATHLVLQHVDFASPCDTADLKQQIEALVAKRLIAPNAAKSVDVDSICWLISSPVGKLLRDNAPNIRRELPLYYPLDPDGPAPENPEDRIMVRSRLDVLVPAADGLHIVDYKTDRVSSTDIDARAELYRGQMEFYRKAVAAMMGKKGPPIAGVHLVFLKAREVRSA